MQMGRIWLLGVGLMALLMLAVPAKEAAASEVVVAQKSSQRAPKTIAISEREIRGKTVATDASGPLQLLFGDGTTLTLGPDSELTIQSYVSDPGTGQARIAATLKRGAFRFIGGRTSKTPDGVALATPFGTIAIQSTVVDLSLGGDGKPAHFDLVSSGSIVLSAGSAVLARVTKQGYSIVPEGGRAAVQKTPAEWRQELQNLLSWRARGSQFAAAPVKHDEDSAEIRAE